MSTIVEKVDNAREVTREMCNVRQIRQYRPDPVPDDVLQELLEVARWSGSARNTQPWHFIVIKDKETLRAISQLRESINWVADAPMAIAIVIKGSGAITEAYDEGRVSERLFVAAHLLGLGAGTAWYGDDANKVKAKQILGIPDDLQAHSVVTIGYPITAKDPRGNRNTPGRNPLSEIVSYERMGSSEA